MCQLDTVNNNKILSTNAKLNVETQFCLLFLNTTAREKESTNRGEESDETEEGQEKGEKEEDRECQTFSLCLTLSIVHTIYFFL